MTFNVEDFTATYLQYDTTVTDRTGNVLFTPYACSICCSTVYPDFAGKRENGHGVVFVKLIGGRNTGKSSLAVSLFNRYKDALMIECTPEYRYYEKMRLGLADGIAPEATIPNVLASPVLMLKSGLIPIDENI